MSVNFREFNFRSSLALRKYFSNEIFPNYGTFALQHKLYFKKCKSDSMNISITVPPFLNLFFISLFFCLWAHHHCFCHGSNPCEPRTVHIRGVSYWTAHAGFHSQICVTLSVRCSQERRCVNYLTSIIQVRSHSIQNANMSGVLQSMYHRFIILGIIQQIVHIQRIYLYKS